MNARSLLRLLAGVALGLAALLAGMGAQAQPAAARESAVKAAFLYKFAGFVDWPRGTFQSAEQSLVIGVAGDEEVATDLEQLVAARPDDRHVAVRRIHEGTPAAGVHVLFLGARREARLREAIDAVKGPVLIVTEQPGALQLGSVLNFAADAGRMRFSASLPSAEVRGLKLSSRLLAVAQVVEARNR